MRFLYELFIQLYRLGLHVAALFSSKARKWVLGRKGLMQRMRDAAALDAQLETVRPLVWFHCASLGEFEQGRPVIEKFRETHTRWRILLTFFSPSGFEVRKDYPVADHVFYLPIDTGKNARHFLDIWQPRLAVFVKYEYWYNFMAALAKREVPMLVISAIFRPEQYFFRFYGRWFLRQLKQIKHFFVQDEASKSLLTDNGIQQVTVSGDTRFDRVWRLSQAPETVPGIAEFAENNTMIIAGSTWPKDEALLQPLIDQKLPNVKFIIAPHEVHEERIRQLESALGIESHRYSALESKASADAKVLIIDCIGLLSQIYQYGHIAYIGGGFGQGIHNILEAAAFGMPVFFGPNYEKFAEARALIDLRGAFTVQSGKELKRQVNRLLNNPVLLEKHAKTCKQYVEGGKGATDLIIDYRLTITD